MAYIRQVSLGGVGPHGIRYGAGVSKWSDAFIQMRNDFQKSYGEWEGSQYGNVIPVIKYSEAPKLVAAWLDKYKSISGAAQNKAGDTYMKYLTAVALYHATTRAILSNGHSVTKTAPNGGVFSALDKDSTVKLWNAIRKVAFDMEAISITPTEFDVIYESVAESAVEFAQAVKPYVTPSFGALAFLLKYGPWIGIGILGLYAYNALPKFKRPS